jgi:predicted helicase
LVIPMYTAVAGRGLKENVTTWGLEAFRTHYGPLVDPALRKNGIHRVPTSLAQVRAARAQGLRRREDLPEPTGTEISNADVFHYVYAVLNDPIYQEQHAERLSTGQPVIPLYPDFRRWRDHGKQLLQLHTGYEMIEPWPLGISRTIELANGKRSATRALITRIKVDQGSNSIELDAHTRIQEIPREAWEHRIGDRSALEWVTEHFQDRMNERSSKSEPRPSPGIRHTDNVELAIQLLKRVCRVSVETQRLVRSMESAER